MRTKMMLSATLVAVFMLLGVGIKGESTDIELDRKAMRMHQIDSLVSGAIIIDCSY